MTWVRDQPEPTTEIRHESRRQSCACLSDARDDSPGVYDSPIESDTRTAPEDERRACAQARFGRSVGREGGDDLSANRIRMLSRRPAIAAADDGVGPGPLRRRGAFLEEPRARGRPGRSR